MKTSKFILTLFILSCFMISCGSDDDGSNNEVESSDCKNIIDQTAKGTFKGVDFTTTGGSYRFQAKEYFCRIYVSNVTGGDCAFPEFGGNEGVILFRLANLEPQTIKLSDIQGEGESLNFNSQEYDDNGIDMFTDVELAECGQLEILSSTSTTVSGRLVGKGQNDSSINGNFTLTLCED